MSDSLTNIFEKTFPTRTSKCALLTLLLAITYLFLGGKAELKPLLFWDAIMTVLMIFMVVIDLVVDPWLRRHGIRK